MTERDIDDADILVGQEVLVTLHDAPQAMVRWPPSTSWRDSSVRSLVGELRTLAPPLKDRLATHAQITISSGEGCPHWPKRLI